MELIKYEAARKAIAEARSIDDVKDIRDKVEALKAYAKQKHDVEMECWLSEIRVRAIRRMGDISTELEKAKGNQYSVELPSGGKQQSKAQTLKAAGISTSVANRCEKIAEMPEKEFEKYIAKKKDERKPVKITEVIAAVTSKTREEKQKKKLQEKPPNIAEGLMVGDFRELANEIPDESVELIFTDPPYDRESIPLFEDAAKQAARILRPGGSMIAYCGQIQLPEILYGMSEHLRYWWVNACVHSGGANQMHKYGIKNQWKPMVWFVKGTRGDVQTFVNDSVTGDREKSHHAWQQAQSEAEYYINLLCSQTGIVVDFFAGGGTTLVAAQKLKRKWIGFEIDQSAAGKASARLNAA